MTGYESFSIYNAVKLHMTTDSYDFFKYNGKSNISVDAFERRKDKYYFYKLSRKYTNTDEYVLFLVANFLSNDKVWAGDLLQEDADIVFRKRQKVIQSLSYIFENECKDLFETCEDPNSLLKVNEDYPELLTKCLHDKISIETICILNSILNFIPMWSKKINDDLFWPTYRKRIVKYTSFLPVNDVKFKMILKKVIAK
jgi:hypothetical protein